MQLPHGLEHTTYRNHFETHRFCQPAHSHPLVPPLELMHDRYATHSEFMITVPHLLLHVVASSSTVLVTHQSMHQSQHSHPFLEPEQARRLSSCMCGHPSSPHSSLCTSKRLFRIFLQPTRLWQAQLLATQDGAQTSPIHYDSPNYMSAPSALPPWCPSRAP